MKIATAIGAALAATFGASGPSWSQDEDAISVSTGSEAWEESYSVKISQEFRCRSASAVFDAEISRDGVRSLALAVNGKKVTANDVAKIVADVNRQGGFSYVGFVCTPDFYAFTFYPNDQGHGQPYVYQGRVRSN